MKDRVFIAWSGSNKTALLVKEILEKKYNYYCAVGGNSDNNSNFSSVGDTVIQQIKSCNQAIIIFQNRADGCVSNNLFFELGYVLAMYGPKKIHCVRLATDKVVLPSDFDGSFVEPIEAEGVDNFAIRIVDYFMGRQKMSVNENKMYLINNRYIIHDMLRTHYSEEGSKCSDYELAQYVMFYTQAAHMFNDEENVYAELLEFKQKHNFELSNELALALNMDLTYLDVVRSLRNDPYTNEIYIDSRVFWNAKREYEHYKKLLAPDEVGIFDDWARIFLEERLAFFYMLVADNPEVEKEQQYLYNEKCAQAACNAIEAIEKLEKIAPCHENNDSVGILSLLRAYLYRNLYLSKYKTGYKDEASRWLEETLREREKLKNTFGKGTIDTQLYNTFCMEYYLSLVNYLSFQDKGDVDDFEIEMYKQEIMEYLKTTQKDENKNLFLMQISRWCEED